jgi:hypothetical protein
MRHHFRAEKMAQEISKLHSRFFLKGITSFPFCGEKERFDSHSDQKTCTIDVSFLISLPLDTLLFGYESPPCLHCFALFFSFSEAISLFFLCSSVVLV